MGWPTVFYKKPRRSCATKNRPYPCMKGTLMRMERILGLLAILFWVGGCGTSDGPDTFDPKVNLETTPQQRLESLQAENQRLKGQVATLTHLPASLRDLSLYDIKEVRLGRYTDLYDKDNDGTKEKLIVYIKPIDDDGDVIKALGQVDVELWDLNQGPQKARLDRWSFTPKELKQQWYATFGQLNYRLVFDVGADLQGRSGPFTVKLVFTDVVYGRVFHDQTTVSFD